VDNGFNPGTGVKAFAAQVDGKVLLGGDSLTIGGNNLKGLAPVDSNGTLDSTFFAELSPHPSISTITLQVDGQVLISGPDVTGNARPDYNLLTRLAADGRRDSTFVAGAYRGGWANWMMAQPNGKLIIGGRFPFLDGTNDASVARLNNDGSLDAVLSTNRGMEHAVPQPDGKWLVPEASASFNADYGVDNSFIPPVVDNQVLSSAAQADGRVLIGGNFSTVNGVNRSGIARLNADGTVDAAFAPEISSSGNSIYSVRAQPHGKILIGGEFFSAEQAHYYGLARLTADGSLDSSFNHIFAENGSPVPVGNIVLRPDGKILITGNFFYVHGARRDYIARLDADGSLDNTFDAGSYSDDPAAQYVRGASSITLHPDGSLFVLGDYYLGDDQYLQGAYHLNANGSVDANFNPSGGLPFDVRSVAVPPMAKCSSVAASLRSMVWPAPIWPGSTAILLGMMRRPWPSPARLMGRRLWPPQRSVQVTASDSDGDIARVDVYSGDTLIGSANSEPFEFTWNEVAPGNYTLMVVATDNLGATTPSAPFNISVTNVGPLYPLSARGQFHRYSRQGPRCRPRESFHPAEQGT
jgi:uncharacterized delta-60 repeat protein